MTKKVAAWFEKHSDEEFLEFDRIPEADRRHVRPDLCGMLYLHEKLGGEGDAVIAAEHDEIFLAWVGNGLTEGDVIYLLRCGVRLGDDGLCMFA